MTGCQTTNFKTMAFRTMATTDRSFFRLLTLLLPIAAIWLLTSPVLRANEPPARTALDAYIAKKDSSYRWKKISSFEGEGFVCHILDMTSQTWLDKKRVDRTEWQHWLKVTIPTKVNVDTAFLMIGGGANGGKAPTHPDRASAGIALANGCIVAELSMIPNQALTFDSDGTPRKEDDLIAYAWRRYLTTGDTEWLPRFPMVKSAVRAMDTLEAFLARPDAGSRKISKFIVAGGSKRGWTTWLTGLDSRVTAIIPIVIDMLNLRPSMEHHYAAYGFWAPAVGDYVRHRVMDFHNTKEYQKLLGLVDPYFYRHRLSKPKYMVNSSGDQFFLPDSSQFYFDKLEGEKYLRYVPNSDHSLRDSDAVQSIAAYFLAVATGTPRPEFSWRMKKKTGDLIVKTKKTQPLEVRLWQASNTEARDFRMENIGRVWTSEKLEDPRGKGRFKVPLKTPAKGWTAYFVELSYKGVAKEPLKFTTSVYVLPDVLPHLDKWKEFERSAKP